MSKQVWIDIWEFMVKYAALIFTLGATSTMKVIIDNRQKRLTWWGILTKYFIAITCGALTARYCRSHGYGNAVDWAAPIATLSGESIITWLTFHWNGIYRYFVKRYTGMKDKDIDTE